MREQGGIDIRMVIRTDGGPDPNRYNVPTAPEITVPLLGSGHFGCYSEQSYMHMVVVKTYHINSLCL